MKYFNHNFETTVSILHHTFTSIHRFWQQAPRHEYTCVCTQEVAKRGQETACRTATIRACVCMLTKILQAYIPTHIHNCTCERSQPYIIQVQKCHKDCTGSPLTRHVPSLLHTHTHTRMPKPSLLHRNKSICLLWGLIRHVG